jgi:hypothetical protein
MLCVYPEIGTVFGPTVVARASGVRAHRTLREVVASAIWMAVGLLALAQPLAAQPIRTSNNPPNPAHTLPSVVGRGKLAPACLPGDTSKNCAARHATIQRVIPAPTTMVYKPREYGVGEPRFVPPKIVALLHDRRIDPQTRAFLEMVAVKPTKRWTLGELAIVQQLVPTLTEMMIPTAQLSDFYAFLGLNPTQLFVPQLADWQNGTTAFDARNYDSTQQAQCLYLLGVGENPDPSSVTLGELAACSENTSD